VALAWSLWLTNDRGGVEQHGGEAGAPHAGPAADGPPPPGLSLRHNPPLEPPPGDYVVSIARGGRCSEWKEKGRPRPGCGGERSSVRGFSKASRRNMLRVVNSINQAAVTDIYFATLTYPEQHKPTWATIERDRDVWCKRFARHWGSESAFIVWKKELTEAGTVHLHALIFWVVPKDQRPRLKGPGGFWEWNDAAWAQVANTGHPDHQRVGCKVVSMRSWNGVALYTAKYVAKDQAAAADTGRIWGVFGRKLYARICSTDLQHVPKAAGVKARRVLRKLQARRRERWLVKEDGGRWRPIKPLPRVPVALQVERARSCGLRVKRSRPSCMRTETLTIWGQVDGTCRVEPVGEERHTFSASLHFVSEETSRRLLMWAMEAWLEEIEGV
jgi:hypothetical protein